MDYDKMLQFHKEKNAEATIAVIEVPMEEACRFGIMNTKDDYLYMSLKKSQLILRVIWHQWVFIYLTGRF